MTATVEVRTPDGTTTTHPAETINDILLLWQPPNQIPEGSIVRVTIKHSRDVSTIIPIHDLETKLASANEDTIPAP